MANENTAILTVVVLPHSAKFSYFYINGLEEKHTKRVWDLVDFLGELCPKAAMTIRKYVYDGTPFILNVEESEIFEIEEVQSERISLRNLHFPKNKVVREAELSNKKTDLISQEQNRFPIILRTKNVIYRKSRKT